MDSRTMTDGAVDGRLELDVPCAQCGYNLRMRTPEDFCPECGLAVKDSVAHYERAARLFREPARFRQGVLLLSCTLFFNVGALPVNYGLYWLSRGASWAHVVMVIFFSVHRLVEVAGIVAATGLIGSSLRLPSLMGGVAGSVRRLFYGCVGFWAAGGLIVTWIYWRMMAPTFGIWLARLSSAIRIFSSLFLTVAEIVGMMVILVLLFKMNRRRLAAWAGAFFAAMLVLEMVNVLMLAWLSGILMGFPPRPSMALIASIDIPNGIFCFCFAVFWLNVRQAVTGPLRAGLRASCRV
jgi:hypothetical protein